MPNPTCTLTTACHAHPILHRLSEVAQELTDLYDGVDLPYHAASTQHGDLLLTRLFSDGSRLAAQISQTGEHTLEASMSSAAHSEETLREIVSPLVTAYLRRYPDASENISTSYQVA